MPDLERLAVLEEDSDQIIFISPESGQEHPKALKVEPTEEEKQSIKAENSENVATVVDKSIVLDMIYVKDRKGNFLMTSSNDGSIRLWRYSGGGFVPAIQGDESIKYPKAQVCLAW